MDAARIRQVERRLVTGLFVLGLALPLPGTLAGRHETVSVAEQRALAAAPSLPASMEGWLGLPRATSAWFDDHFGGRELLVRLHRRLARVARPGVLAAAPVLEGRDGWLYFSGDHSLEDHQGLLPLTQEQLAGWGTSLAAKQRHLAARGIAYLFVITPSKHSIHPEFLPDWLAGRRGETRADQLVRYLANRGDVPVLDLRAGLLLHKGAEPLYRRHDTHWNIRGADLGRRLIIEALAGTAPALALATPAFGPWQEKEVAGGDLLRMLGREELVEVVPRLQVDRSHCRMNVTARGTGGTGETGAGATLIDECDNDGPDALVFRDSFMIALRPLLSPHFHRSVYVWQRPDPCLVQRLADRYAPDAVIEQTTERFLVLPPPACAAGD